MIGGRFYRASPLADLTTNLAYKYPMETGDLSGSTLLDRSGNGRNATTYGSPAIDANGLNCLSASNQYAVVTGNVKTVLGTTFSLAFRVKLSGAQSNKGIFSIADSGTTGNPWIFLQRYTATTIRWFLNGGYQFTDSSISDNTDYDLALTFDGSVWRFYKEGSLFGSYTGTIGSLGGIAMWISVGFGGSANTIFKNLYVFSNRVLTADDIAAHAALN